MQQVDFGSEFLIISPKKDKKGQKIKNNKFQVLELWIGGWKLSGCVALIFISLACARSPIKNSDQAMRLSQSVPEDLFDDLGGIGLKKALEGNIKALKKRYPDSGQLKFGAVTVEAQTYIQSLEKLADVLEEGEHGGISNYVLWLEFLKSNFDLYEVYGQREWGEAFITSYYEPVIKGSKVKKIPYTQPLYRVPEDMVKIAIADFAEIRPKLKDIYQDVMEQKSRGPILRGRLIKTDTESASYLIKPYFARSEIDEGKALKNRRLEIVYVDPIDSFFLQIQGSGIVELKNGKKLRIGYASQNGHPYVPIGKFLFDVIPKDKMSMAKIEDHLRTLSPDQLNEILNKNPSYVFFRELEGGAVGFLGAEVIPGRTIATDTKYFPKGALGFLEFEKPIFSDAQAKEPVDWQKTSRFVFDQDTGGAIRGPGRLDLFWGQGDLARQSAGVMKNYGRLQYLVPKPSFIAMLSQIETARP